MDLELRAGVLSVSVYLRAEQPGCGHGLAALTAAIKAARSMGAQRILAEMEEENAASIRRCTRVGMTLRPDRNKHNDLVFELDLTSSWPTPPPVERGLARPRSVQLTDRRRSRLRHEQWSLLKHDPARTHLQVSLRETCAPRSVLRSIISQSDAATPGGRSGPLDGLVGA